MGDAERDGSLHAIVLTVVRDRCDHGRGQSCPPRQVSHRVFVHLHRKRYKTKSSVEFVKAMFKVVPLSCNLSKTSPGPRFNSNEAADALADMTAGKCLHGI